jgi:2-amino-4-hydroxy-6-hydroxymethyldihydropteridine diphosphokinase
MVIAYIGIGSNLGDRHKYITHAIRKLKMLPGVKVMRVSELIETEPCGGPVQGPYLNGVIEIDTDLTPYGLLVDLQKIEHELGRVRTVVNGPRTIDLDILTFGEYCVDEIGLCVPHPRMLERDFVMKPLAAIAPHAVALVKRLRVKKQSGSLKRDKNVALLKKQKKGPKRFEKK